MSSQRARPVLIRAGQAPTFWHPNIRSEILLASVQSSNTLSVIHQFHYGKGARINPCLHERDIGMYIIAGTVSYFFASDGTPQVAKPGTFVNVPRATPFDGTFDEEVTETLMFTTPAGVDQLIVQSASCSARGPGRPPADLEATPKDQLATVFDVYGVRYLGGLPTKAALDSMTTLPGATPQPLVVNPADAPSFWVQPAIPELWTVLASGAQTGGAFTLTDMSFTKGNAAKPMKYAHHDESYYVLAGRATLLLNDRVETVSKGDFVFIPRGTAFAVRGDSDDEMFRVLMIHTPSGIIEGSLGMLPCVKAEDKTKPPPGLGEKRPEVDPVVAMARLRCLGIDILGVADPLAK